MMNSLKNVWVLSKQLLLVVCCYSILRLLFYFFNFHFFSSLGLFQLIKLLVWALRFDVSTIIITNALFIALYLVPFKYRENNRYKSILKWLFVIVNSICMLANCVDLVYFPFTLKRSTYQVFGFLNGTVGNDFYTLLPSLLLDFWYIPLLWFALSFCLYKLYCKQMRNVFLIWNKKEYLKQCSVFILSLALSVLLYRGGFQLKPITIISAGEYTEAKYIPLVINTPFSIIKTSDVGGIQPHNYLASSQQVEQLYTTAHQSINNKPFEAKNVMLIILESFSKEYIGSLNASGKGFTPFLDSIISQGLVFTNAYANGKTSIEGIPAIVAGMPTWMNEPYITSAYGANNIQSLASLLKEKGYTTSFFHGGTNGTMGFEAFSRLAGYQYYYGKNEYNNLADDDGNWGIWDEPFLQFVAQKANATQQPFFSTVFTLSSHHPFALPKKYKTTFAEGPLPIHKSIAYADFALKQFFKTAQKTNWFKNTLFVLCADHTSISNNDFYLNKAGNNTIPIVFYAGDNSLKGSRNTITQQIDIMPTILDVLNYPLPYFSFGNNALDSTAQHFAFTYNNGVSLLFQNEYVLEFDGEKTTSIYNPFADSLLQNNLFNKETGIRAKMELQTKAILQSYEQALINNKTHWQQE
jgi:phosphoglycerol transferase MdoB-like AlkP superfamily enzyme